jgi:hypothetical protein
VTGFWLPLLGIIVLGLGIVAIPFAYDLWLCRQLKGHFRIVRDVPGILAFRSDLGLFEIDHGAEVLRIHDVHGVREIALADISEATQLGPRGSADLQWHHVVLRLRSAEDVPVFVVGQQVSYSYKTALPEGQRRWWRRLFGLGEPRVAAAHVLVRVRGHLRQAR